MFKTRYRCLEPNRSHLSRESLLFNSDIILRQWNVRARVCFLLICVSVSSLRKQFKHCWTRHHHAFVRTVEKKFTGSSLSGIKGFSTAVPRHVYHKRAKEFPVMKQLKLSCALFLEGQPSLRRCLIKHRLSACLLTQIR